MNESQFETDVIKTLSALYAINKEVSNTFAQIKPNAIALFVDIFIHIILRMCMICNLNLCLYYRFEEKLFYSFFNV